MTLAALIRKRETVKPANANLAKVANDERARGEPLAGLATLALANTANEKTASMPGKVLADDTATASCWWRIHYPGREPVEVACCPPATHAEMLAWRPDAIVVEPFEPTPRQPDAPLTANDEAAIRAWLAHIEETNESIIANVLNQCQQDADARDYYLRRVREDLRKTEADTAGDDDRRTCAQCANLTGRGLCLAAQRGEIVASRNYEPIRDLPRRCEGYMPGVDDADRRSGRERWPGLIQKGGE